MTHYGANEWSKNLEIEAHWNHRYNSSTHFLLNEEWILCSKKVTAGRCWLLLIRAIWSSTNDIVVFFLISKEDKLKKAQRVLTHSYKREKSRSIPRAQELQPTNPPKPTSKTQSDSYTTPPKECILSHYKKW